MSTTENLPGSKVLADPVLLQKIDRLMELGVGESVPLTQLVVVGDQSSGKSSVLEGLTGLPFPRDSSLCTRYATQIVFSRAKDVSITVSIIPSTATMTEDPTTAERLRSFEARIEDLTMEKFAEVLSQASSEMGIFQSTDDRKPGQSAFSEHMLKIQLAGPDRDHLSVVDVPGIFRNVQEGLTTEADKLLVSDMVEGYIKNKRSIILAVMPLNVDIATQDVLNLAKKHDPSGERTLGVLTKPDLMDKGTEHDALSLVRGDRHKLTLGYCVMRNRKQTEGELDHEARNQAESEFFRRHPWSDLPKERVGVTALRNILTRLHSDISLREFPHIRRDIDQKLRGLQEEADRLGPSRESDDDQRRYLLDLAVKFQQHADEALEARYGAGTFFDDVSARLATQIITLNDEFAEKLRSNGHSVQFADISTSNATGTTASTYLKPEQRRETIRDWKKKRSRMVPTPSTTDSNDATSDDLDLSSWTQRTIKPLTPTYPELEAILPDIGAAVTLSKKDVLGWIQEHHAWSRGFEIGTFNNTILPLLFRQQTANWEVHALEYIRTIIYRIHHCCNRLLTELCPERKIRGALQSIMVDRQLELYTKAVNQVKFILATERDGNLLTTNHYFSDNLEKVRADRIRKAQEATQEADQDGYWTTTASSSERVGGISNLDHTIQDIHDILKAYYKVALKRFTDCVCKQATDYYLVAGPSTPLKVFSPTFVGELSKEQLKAIAGEDFASVQKRNELSQIIARLRESKKVLAA